MTIGSKELFDNIRELKFNFIKFSYSKLGKEISTPSRIVAFFNHTDVDIYFSTDGVNDKFRLNELSSITLNLASNQIIDQGFFLPAGTQFYVRRAGDGAPTNGSCSIMTIYADPGI